MIAEIDVDGNGSIDFTEFKDMMFKKRDQLRDTIDPLADAYMVLDYDDSGYFSLSHLHDIMCALGENIELSALEALVKAARKDMVVPPGFENSIDKDTFRRMLCPEVRAKKGKK